MKEQEITKTPEEAYLDAYRALVGLYDLNNIDTLKIHVRNLLTTQGYELPEDIDIRAYDYQVTDNDDSVKNFKSMSKYFKLGAEEECVKSLLVIVNLITIYYGYELGEDAIRSILKEIIIKEELNLIFDIEKYTTDEFVNIVYDNVVKLGIFLAGIMFVKHKIKYPDEVAYPLYVCLDPIDGVLLIYTTEDLIEKSIKEYKEEQ